MVTTEILAQQWLKHHLSSQHHQPSSNSMMPLTVTQCLMINRQCTSKLHQKPLHLLVLLERCDKQQDMQLHAQCGLQPMVLQMQ